MRRPSNRPSRVRRGARTLLTATGAFLALCGALLTLAAPDVGPAETDEPLSVSEEPSPAQAALALERDASWLWPATAPPPTRQRARRLTSRARAAFEDAQIALGRDDQGMAAQHLAVGLDQLSELTETLADPPSPQP